MYRPTIGYTISSNKNNEIFRQRGKKVKIIKKEQVYVTKTMFRKRGNVLRLFNVILFRVKKQASGKVSALNFLKKPRPGKRLFSSFRLNMKKGKI